MVPATLGVVPDGAGDTLNSGLPISASIAGAGGKARKQPETSTKQVTEYGILESVDAAMLLMIVSTNYK